jgi:hypothetical protein
MRWQIDAQGLRPAPDAAWSRICARRPRAGRGPRPEVDRLEDFVGRFPAGPALTGGAQRAGGQLERAVEALNDRMTHDPHLSQSLHELLSALTSVRATAAILAETRIWTPDWAARFHRNLHQDSERLAGGAEALVAYLDAGQGSLAEQGIAAPQEEVEDWLRGRAGIWPRWRRARRAAVAGRKWRGWPHRPRGAWPRRMWRGPRRMRWRCRWPAFRRRWPDRGPIRAAGGRFRLPMPWLPCGGWRLPGCRRRGWCCATPRAR